MTYRFLHGCLIVSFSDGHNNVTEYLQQHFTFVQHLPLGLQLVPAVDGRQIDLYKWLRERKLTKVSYNDLVVQNKPVTGHYLTLGSLGCLYAHVLAWQRVVQLNKSMLIIEDDAYLDRSRFDVRLPDLLNALPADFSLLYFGNLVGKSMDLIFTHYNDLLWKVNGSNWGTYAYLISPSAAATLLKFIYPVRAQVDSMIIEIARSQSLRVFMSKEILVATDNSYRRESRTQRYLVPPVSIPRTFHFIWVGNKSLPAASQNNIDLWAKFHPTWQVRLWTNASVQNSDLRMYNRHRWINFPRSLRQASDILRYEVIYQYGGIYLDVDFEPLRNIESLLHGVQAFVVHETEEFVCNGIFGAVPGHELTERLVTRLDASFASHVNGTVNQQSGPYHMTRQVAALKAKKKTGMHNGLQTFAPHLFFPFLWNVTDPGPPYDYLAFAVHHFRPMAKVEEDAVQRL